MKIRWNGHASFTITANDGTAIVTDPYDPSGFGGVLKHEPVSDRADLVQLPYLLWNNHYLKNHELCLTCGCESIKNHILLFLMSSDAIGSIHGLVLVR